MDQPQSAPAPDAPAEKKPQKSIEQFVAEHLELAEDAHPTVREHLDKRGIRPSFIRDEINKVVVETLHDWRRQALLGRFVAQGLTEDSRISDEAFEKALHEVMHGRI